MISLLNIFTYHAENIFSEDTFCHSVIHGNGANIFYSVSIIHGLLYLGQLHCYVCYGNLILHYVPIFKHALLTKYQEH